MSSPPGSRIRIICVDGGPHHTAEHWAKSLGRQGIGRQQGAWSEFWGGLELRNLGARCDWHDLSNDGESSNEGLQAILDFLGVDNEIESSPIEIARFPTYRYWHYRTTRSWKLEVPGTITNSQDAKVSWTTDTIHCLFAINGSKIPSASQLQCISSNIWFNIYIYIFNCQIENWTACKILEPLFYWWGLRSYIQFYPNTWSLSMDY